MKRIGPRMSDVVRYVTDNPGQPMLKAAEHVGPNVSRRYGYRTGYRCIKAGLITYVLTTRGALLYPV